jgi:alpha-galactosidase/6-phospho-beta-glucosidase family protein
MQDDLQQRWLIQRQRALERHRELLQAELRRVSTELHDISRQLARVNPPVTVYNQAQRTPQPQPVSRERQRAIAEAKTRAREWAQERSDLKAGTQVLTTQASREIRKIQERLSAVESTQEQQARVVIELEQNYVNRFLIHDAGYTLEVNQDGLELRAYFDPLIE